MKRPGEITFPIIRDTVDELVTVGDEEIVEAINLLLERAQARSSRAPARLPRRRC